MLLDQLMAWNSSSESRFSLATVAQQQPLVVSLLTCKGILCSTMGLCEFFFKIIQKKKVKKCSICSGSCIVWRLPDAFREPKSQLITHLHCVALSSFHLAASAARPFSWGQMGNKRPFRHGNASHLSLTATQSSTNIKSTESPQILRLFSAFIITNPSLCVIFFLVVRKVF